MDEYCSSSRVLVEGPDFEIRLTTSGRMDEDVRAVVDFVFKGSRLFARVWKIGRGYVAGLAGVGEDLPLGVGMSVWGALLAAVKEGEEWLSPTLNRAKELALKYYKELEEVDRVE